MTKVWSFLPSVLQAFSGIGEFGELLIKYATL